KVLKYNVHSAQISIHGDNASIHDWATRTRGSFKQTVNGILNLKRINPDLPISVFTVINKKNYKHLLRIARFVVDRLGIRIINLSFIETRGRASDNRYSLIQFSKIYPFLSETLNYLKKSFDNQKVEEFFIEKGPVCMVSNFYENYRSEKLTSVYTKHKACQSCVFENICSGFPKKYVDFFGFDGLRLGNILKEDMKYFFSGINITGLPAIKKNIKFDSFNNPFLSIIKRTNKGNLEKFKNRAKQFGLSLLDWQGELVHVYNDYIVPLPKHISNPKNMAQTDNLISALIDKNKRDFGSILSQKNIALTTGCSHSLFLALMLAIRPRDEVILQKPCWGGYGEGVKNLGGIIRQVGRTMEIKEIEKNYNKKTKLIIINNPYLYDFKVLSGQKIAQLAKFCSDKNIYLVVDEIINYLLPKPVSVLRYYNVERDPIIVVNSFSKNYFMPFYRSGYLIANSHLIKKAKEIIEFSGFKISPKSISASMAALKGNQVWRDKIAQKIYQKGRYF
ncbi:MAG: aminotransferase class I/II-fold pyridoxal phosphate-dependent enzyme, partial [Patescibacteria group bacterium]|nr:aminotransferase class I/II-fold pyridoxal phosphate-dependent enzyme [Patescibacteria group bacterium]